MIQGEREHFLNRYGPWAVVAGASDGTGAAFAEQLASLGFNLLLVSRRAPALEELGQRLQAVHGIAYRALPIDLSHSGAADAMLAASADIDVGLYISNAGVTGPIEKFLDNSLADAQTAIRLNIATLVEAAHGFGNRMRRRGKGGIVIMASLVALGGRPLFTMYAGTKAFGAVFAESLWAELREENIDILGVIAPGMDTPTTKRNRGSDEVMPYHQKATDVVRKSLETLGQEALVYFPLPHETGKYEAIRADRRRELLAGAEWAAEYKKNMKARPDPAGA